MVRFEWYPDILVAGCIGYLPEDDWLVRNIENGKITKARDVYGDDLDALNEFEDDLINGLNVSVFIAPGFIFAVPLNVEDENLKEKYDKITSWVLEELKEDLEESINAFVKNAEKLMEG